ncbi:S49 family peptidase [Chloroflexota bacterium]
MPKLESTKRLLRCWFTSIPFFIALGLILGAVIAVPIVPKPRIAVIAVSGTIMGQNYADEIIGRLKDARDDNTIKAVVLQIDSPGGGVSVTEQIYLDLLRLRAEKPVVASIGATGASGGYYIALASNFIYAQPTSQIGSIGAWSNLPSSEKLDEDTLTTGLFKASTGSKTKATAKLEMVRQEFVSAVVHQRGNRLKMAEEQLSLAELYLGVEGLRYGLIDGIGTVTTAIDKAASLAGVRNYEVVELYVSLPLPFFFGFSTMEDLKSQTGLTPTYYYLYFESE